MIKKILLGFVCLSTFLIATEVTVSIQPQKYFVEKIASDKITVNVMVRQGFSPSTYEPKVSQMRKLSNSKVYFSIGVPFENVWLEKFKNANKNMLVVDTSLGIKKLQMQEHDHHEENTNETKEHEEEHNDDAYHEHESLDPHIWLDPVLVKVQVKHIYETLVKLDKENESFYTENYKAFLSEIDSLNTKLELILKPYESKVFMVFHPSWGYFSNRYNLEQIAIEVQGKEPKPAQLIKLVEEAKEHNIKILFVSPQFSKKGASTISKSLDGNVLIIDPLSYNWEENLIKTAEEIAKSYK
jgi:zinc transport system substrate-binding protein